MCWALWALWLYVSQLRSKDWQVDTRRGNRLVFAIAVHRLYTSTHLIFTPSSPRSFPTNVFKNEFTFSAYLPVHFQTTQNCIYFVNSRAGEENPSCTKWTHQNPHPRNPFSVFAAARRVLDATTLLRHCISTNTAASMDSWMSLPGKCVIGEEIETEQKTIN